MQARIVETDFGKTPDGTVVRSFTLTNSSGASTRIMTYGATVVSLNVPDRKGKMGDVVLGYDRLEGYLRNSPYFGAATGRYANRIGGAKFRLNGIEYKLPANNGPNTLHGGLRGFDKVVWTATKIDGQMIEMSYLSKDGEEDFPGNLASSVRYSLTDANELKIDYRATTDKDTVVNLTNHSYFNLAGQGMGDILGHELTIDADRYTPVDSTSIPAGPLAPVNGTPFDFRTPHTIGERIDADNEQIRFGAGYDHNWVLNRKEGLARAASVYEPSTGRTMEVLTTEPGVQFYTANFLDGTITGKAGKVYQRRSAFCLETQHYPDSPNKPEFPSTVLKPGQVYQSTTIYRFGIRK